MSDHKVGDRMLVGCFGAEDSRSFAFYSATWTPVEMFTALLAYRDRHDHDYDFRAFSSTIEIISVPFNTVIYEEDWEELPVLEASVDWTWTDDENDTLSTLTIERAFMSSEDEAAIGAIAADWNAKEAAKNDPAPSEHDTPATGTEGAR